MSKLCKTVLSLQHLPANVDAVHDLGQPKETKANYYGTTCVKASPASSYLSLE